MPKKKMNALDAAITKGKTLPIKGRKKLPADYDVVVPAMKRKPVPLPKTPKNMKPGMRPKSSKKK